MQESAPGESADDLRRRAEEALGKSSQQIEQLPVKDLQLLVHELQVHQIELKMQNQELRETQLQLEASKDSYTELYEFAPVGYLTLDVQGSIQTANLTASKLIGLERSELIGTKLSQHVAPEDQDALHRLVSHLKANGTRSCDLRVRQLEQLVWTSVQGRVRASDPKSWLVTLTDIRHRKFAEEELRESNRTLEDRVEEGASQLYESSERMAAILNAAADAIITFDERGTVVSINPATETMFGYTKDELLGKDVSIVMLSPYNEKHDDYLARHLKTQRPRVSTRETLGRRKDGTTFPVELSVSKVDHLGLFTAIHRDISERRKLQETILSIAAEEGQRIGQELHDGVGQELTGLSLFAGTLAAGLKDLQGRNTQLREEREEPTFTQLQLIAEKLVRGIEASNKHVHELCHGIMPVHIDAQGLSSALEELVAVTNEYVACRYQCPSRVEIADNMTANHLYKIAQEAVTNALKHSQAKELLISLRRDGEKIILEVMDDGIGVHVTNGGKGLGLGIMDYRAGLIGATLRVNSGKKGGTQVTCTLIPAREPNED